jgi:hypothetical protein
VVHCDVIDPFMKGVPGSDFLDEVLFVGEGNLCVKIV